MAERLQKIIAEAGLMSRRAAERLILDGRVTLNGQQARLGDKADLEDEVFVDGVLLRQKEQKQYFMLNKPRGYVCSLKDEKGRRSVRELLPASAGRVYPAGRLDIMSEGLLIMTNDGEFALKLTHPSCRLTKVYRTSVSGDQLANGIARLSDPFELDGAEVKAVSGYVLKSSGNCAVLNITIGEGRNRQIRRMCELSGLHVDRLVRISEGPLTLGSLPSGKYRSLTTAEISSVMGAYGHEC